MRAIISSRLADDGDHVGQFRHDEFRLVLTRINDMTLVEGEMARLRGEFRGVFFVALHPFRHRWNRRQQSGTPLDLDVQEIHNEWSDQAHDARRCGLSHQEKAPQWGRSILRVRRPVICHASGPRHQ